MKNLLIRNLFRPLIERVGTALAVWMVAVGWNGELIQQFGTALVAVLLVGVDLAFARLNSREAD